MGTKRTWAEVPPFLSLKALQIESGIQFVWELELPRFPDLTAKVGLRSGFRLTRFQPDRERQKQER